MDHRAKEHLDKSANQQQVLNPDSDHIYFSQEKLRIEEELVNIVSPSKMISLLQVQIMEYLEQIDALEEQLKNSSNEQEKQDIASDLQYFNSKYTAINGQLNELTDIVKDKSVRDNLSVFEKILSILNYGDISLQDQCMVEANIMLRILLDCCMNGDESRAAYDAKKESITRSFNLFNFASVHEFASKVADDECYTKPGLTNNL